MVPSTRDGVGVVCENHLTERLTERAPHHGRGTRLRRRSRALENYLYDAPNLTAPRLSSSCTFSSTARHTIFA